MWSGRSGTCELCLQMSAGLGCSDPSRVGSMEESIFIELESDLRLPVDTRGLFHLTPSLSK